MILRDTEVARTFLEVFGFCLFLLLRFILEKYVWYKICSSDFALYNKKNIANQFLELYKNIIDKGKIRDIDLIT